MNTVLFGVAAAALYGAANFVGGYSAKTIDALVTALLACIIGIVWILPLSFFFTPYVFSVLSIKWGLISGAFNGIGIALAYKALSIGPMSITAPIIATITALVPVTWAITHDVTLNVFAKIGIIFAFAAIVLLSSGSTDKEFRLTRKGALLGVSAGIAFGIFFVTFSFSPSVSGLFSVVMNRAGGFAVLLLIIIARHLLMQRKNKRLPPISNKPVKWTPRPYALLCHKLLNAGILFAVMNGVFDSTGDAAFLVGSHLGDLAVVSVLAALYPAGTMLLAVFFLRERLSKPQWAGLACALASGALLALP